MSGIKPFTMNFRGHQGRPDKSLASESFKPNEYPTDRVENTVSMLQMEEHLGRGDESLSRLLRNIGDCYVCGQDLFLEKLDGEAYQYTTACPYPKGIPSYNFKLQVPSGKIVFTNDSRDLVDRTKLENESQYDMNTHMGCLQISQAYERAGMVHFLVGNTCPGIYRMPKGRLRISSNGYHKGGRYQGVVITDLWWVCAMDSDWWRQQVERTNTAPDRNAVFVKVMPGTWAFRFDPNRGCEFRYCEAKLLK